MFITFEGPDGSGKTTHIKLLADRLRHRGLDILQTREPGGTALGDKIRSLVLDHQNEAVDPVAEMLLIAAGRAQHVRQVLRPHLQKDGTVLSDRFVDSSLVYQGHALGLGWERVQQVNEIAISGLWPDLTILLMLSPEEAFARSARVRQRVDRIESRGLEYYQKVCEGYLLLVKRFPERVWMLDARQPISVVHEAIMQLVDSHLTTRLS